jgi:hypothetical protein
MGFRPLKVTWDPHGPDPPDFPLPWQPRPKIREELGHSTGSRCGGSLVSDNTVWYPVIIMIRTQISLSEEEYSAAKSEAKRLGISLAELLRRSLRGILPADPSKPWMRYAGMVESGDAHSSQRIDDIVYGQKD